MSENNMKFQPMPKRFMVWDKISKQFRGDGKILSWEEIACMLCPSPLDSEEEVREREQRYELVQSTNLFDKDGKEIFEGSIVENDYGWIGVVVQYKGQWVVNYRKATPVSVWHLLYDIKNDIKLVDHILSNPKLLEEK